MPISAATLKLVPSYVEHSEESTKPSDAKITPEILNFGNAIIKIAKGSEIISANSGKIVDREGEYFYVKNAGNFPFASREVSAAKIYGLFARAPEEFLVDHCNDFIENVESNHICIASKWVDYLDFGDWMIKESSADALKKQFPEFSEANIIAFKKNANKAKELSEDLEKLRNENSGDWWISGVNSFPPEGIRAPNQKLVKQYQPKAKQLDQIMKEQFSLLPEKLQKEMQEHLAVSQLIGDWDPINPFYRNMGIVKEETGELHVMRLDFGSSLDVGFNNEPKETGFNTAVNQRPAVFPELSHVFTKENAIFSEKLPKLAEELNNLPYADYAKSIAGKFEWLESTRMKIAYRCMLLKQNTLNNKNAIEDIIQQVLIDESTSSLGLKTKESLIETINARIDALINEQCGESDKIYEWETEHLDVAKSIREDISSKLGTNVQPLNNTFRTYTK